ncbi:hypothetical protein [Planctomicrobium sp. SH527]|uniref:hypothetical protein n=1 Tax=Planctomicrobium sp. SH527 TaxID=3448123 RepID=UPI003F5B71E8
METVQQLQQILQSVEPAVYLVEPRILRRVIRMDRNLQGLSLLVPHEFSYTIERDRLLMFVELSELDVAPNSDLPRLVILLPRPEEESRTEKELARLGASYHRRTFHETIHIELENLVVRRQLDEEVAQLRKQQLGDIEFSEIRDILLKDDYLFPSPTDLDVYIEFVATYLELRYFAPHEVRLHFPALRDWDIVDEIIQQDFDHFSRFEQLRPLTKLFIADQEATQEVVVHTLHSDGRSKSTLTLAQLRILQAKAERAAAAGNSVKATLSHMKLSRRAPAEHVESSYEDALAELGHLAQRLQAVLELPLEEVQQWTEALKPLLEPASQGYWSNEARLLYDLQKVCLEQERGVFKLDLIDWIRTFGRHPIRRPLPLMQDALTLRHLKTIRRRISVARIDAVERSRLLNLLNSASPRVEHRSRNRIRNIITDVFDSVGLVPENIPEQVARRKIVEELLDRVVEKSYFSISDLRDTLSRNQLKLPDVTRFREVIFGDGLLRADRKFDAVLDGVYRPGAIYQRWPQTLSSLFFGTPSGRFLTQHLFIPFGGAYLAIVFFEHVIASFTDGHGAHDAGLQSSSTAAGSGTEQSIPEAILLDEGGDASGEVIAEIAPVLPDVSELASIDPAHLTAHAHAEAAAASVGPSFQLIAGVLILGTWISLLIQKPAFRQWNRMVLSRLWQAIHSIFIEFPSKVLHSEYFQQILKSRGFRIFRDYLLDPAVCLFLMWLPAYFMGYRWSGRLILELYLGTALFLTSPIGRYVSELSSDFLMRAWNELKNNIFSAVIQAIADLFDSLMVNLERFVYMVDEFLRFRAGDNPISHAIKLAAGVVWFLVSYIVVFVFTLLVEPQINPIKHFPVVTVSHKVILPTGPILVRELTPYLGVAQANTIVWTCIWLIPGVFGFLVWELKENWRLYAANRRPRLERAIVGDHGESMLQLLRPGFHSGTLPKAFSALRRESSKVSHVDHSWVLRKWGAVIHAEESVRHFVERELLHLFEEAHEFTPVHWEISSVRAATNRIDVEICNRDAPEQMARLTWEYHDNKLLASMDPAPLVDPLPTEVQHHIYAALSGLLQRSRVDLFNGPGDLRLHPAYTWETWVGLWSKDPTPESRTEQNRLGVAQDPVAPTAT